MALTIGELVGFIRADDSGMRRGLDDAELRLRGFVRDADGQLRHLDGRFASASEQAALGLRDATDEGDRFNLSLGRIAGMASGLLGVAGGFARIAATVGAAVPVAGALVTTLANIAPAAGVGVTAMLALKQATLTVKLATQGMEEALSAALDPSKAEEFQEALKGLSPEAKQFALAVRDIAPAWAELQQEVQDEFFRGLSDNFDRLATSAGPILRKELLSTSTALGDMAAGAMGAATALAEDGTLGQAMGSASDGLANLSGMPGVVVTALGQIAAAAGPSFDRLTAKAADAGFKIGEKLNKAFESGRMEQAIEEAIDLLGDLWDVGKNVGEIISDIFGAVPDEGGGLVGTLETITGALKEITGTPEFQEGMTALFETVSELAETAAPLLAEALALVAPILTELAPHVQDLIAKLGEGLTPILEELKSSGLLETLAAGIGEIADSLGPLLPPLGELVAAILPLLTPLVRLATEGVKLLGEVIKKWVVPAIEALTALLRGDFSGAWEKAKEAADGARELISRAGSKISEVVEDAVNAAVRWLKGLPGRAFAALSTLAGYLRGRAAEAGAQLALAIARKVDEAVQWLRDLPGRAVSAVGNLGGVLLSAGRALIQGFIDGIRSKIGAVQGVLGGITAGLTSWKGPESLDKRILTPAGRLVISGFQRGIELQTPALREQLQGLTAGLQGEVAMAGTPTTAAVGGGRTTTNHYTYNLTQREMTLRDLEALQSRQNTLARVGRPR